MHAVLVSNVRITEINSDSRSLGDLATVGIIYPEH